MEGLQGMAPMILFLVLIFAAMYFLMIKPQRKKQKDFQDLMSMLKKGDKVITAGGIYGQIENLGEDTVVLKVDSGATIKVARGSITGKQGIKQPK
ncbi:MAG: preprotein translocase subunit YajC [Chloroflexota bacterium]|nr:preprotein translocase subunit YajC [Chloroflexota bacterium]